jgi:hypothetical protein
MSDSPSMSDLCLSFTPHHELISDLPTVQEMTLDTGACDDSSTAAILEQLRS